MSIEKKHKTLLEYERPTNASALDSGPSGCWRRGVIVFGIPPIALGWLLIGDMLRRGSLSFGDGIANFFLLILSLPYLLVVFLSLDRIADARYRQRAYLMMLILIATVAIRFILMRSI